MGVLIVEEGLSNRLATHPISGNELPATGAFASLRR